jgi:hypothetical protein
LGVGLLLVSLFGSGCVSQQPLPFAYSTPVPASVGAPKLTVLPTQDERLKHDDMDKVLKLPECLDPVIVKELDDSGLFGSVELNTNEVPKTGYLLQCRINELRWEVPNYGRLVGTVGVVSVLTGGVGGVIYGSTDTDVLGHANVHFNLTNLQGNQMLLDRDYIATITEKKAKLNCDTPATYREVAAKSFQTTIEQFEKDVRHMSLK